MKWAIKFEEGIKTWKLKTLKLIYTRRQLVDNNLKFRKLLAYRTFVFCNYVPRYALWRTVCEGFKG